MRSPVEKPPRLEFLHSDQYWKERYESGLNSGAGSYGRLAEFKAEVLNAFVAQNAIRSVIAFGCGDGAQLSLAAYPSYVGVDVSDTALSLCRARFSHDETKRFALAPATFPPASFDVSLSPDVIYHLIEDDVFDAYMGALFDAAARFVVIYASDRDAPGPAPHVRHRAFTRWVAVNRPGWRLQEAIQNRYPFDEADPDQTSFSDFQVFARNGDLSPPS